MIVVHLMDAKLMDDVPVITNLTGEMLTASSVGKVAACRPAMVDMN